MAWLGLGFLLFLVFGLLTALSRAHELYCVSVRRGRALVVRGALPQSALVELQSLLGTSPSEVLIRGFDREEGLQVDVRGATAAQERTIEEVLGALTVEDLPPILPRDRTWWRIAGFVWLAWWMDGRDRDDPPEDPPPSNITPFRSS